MNNLINIFVLYSFLFCFVFVFDFLLWSCLKLQDTVALMCGHTLGWKWKIHMDHRNLSLKYKLFWSGLRFVLPTLFSKLLTQISAASQDVDADLLRRSAVNSTGFWRSIPALPILHLLPDPPQGRQPRSVWGFASSSLERKTMIVTLKIKDTRRRSIRWCLHCWCFCMFLWS